ncbi:hypothetical protein TrLO_g12926 [Triparma laevis f. longispina]|uniref:Uncharacterized protein n=1 Tax=Triparma laevis f. longispina TaxID=1714387 RepID=A0A9W7FQS6_9STRA|nr:hypothetical protein TrLO_g12926 [Triparma laevis f. longispina]
MHVPLSQCPLILLYLIDNNLSNNALELVTECINHTSQNAPLDARIGICVYLEERLVVVDMTGGGPRLVTCGNEVESLEGVIEMQSLVVPFRNVKTCLESTLRLLSDFKSLGLSTPSPKTTSKTSAFSFSKAINIVKNSFKIRGVHPGSDIAAIVGDRFSKKCSTKTKKMTQDEEDEGLNLSLKNNKVIEEMNMWNSLGDECNEAAIGVDVFGILESEEEEIGINTLMPLVLRSGGTTCVCSIRGFEGSVSPIDVEKGDFGTPASLVRECITRSGWHRPTAFGGGLRIRNSKTFGIVRGSNKGYTSMSQFYQSGGMVGGCSRSQSDPELWTFGCLDDNTTIGFDLELRPGVGGGLNVEGYGGNGMSEEASMSPAIQLAFAYTAVLPANGEKLPHEEELSDNPGANETEKEYIVVRQCRVFTTNLDTTPRVEEVYDALDCEALAVTLFNKFYLATVEKGVVEGKALALDWLIGMMGSIYKSAEQEEVAMFEDGDPSNGYTHKHGKIVKKKPVDFKNRLIDREGSDLSKSDVLLAQGHEFLSALPLLVYSLMSCDPLRLSENSYFPTTDSRICAMLNAARFNPPTMVKYLAPRFEFWEDRDNSVPHTKHVSLSQYAVTTALTSIPPDTQDPLMLLETPQVTLVHYTNVMGGPARGERGGREEDDVGDELELATKIGHVQYSTQPPRLFVRAGRDGAWRMHDFLIEDSCVEGGFEEFCKGVVDQLESELF